MKTNTILHIATTLALLTADSLSAEDAVWTASSGVLPTSANPEWQFRRDGVPGSATLTPDAVRLQSADLAYTYYFQRGAQLVIPDTLIIETRVRFVSGTSSDSARGPAGIGFTTKPGVGNWLWIGQDEVFVNAANLERGPSATVDTDDSFHTYRIEVHGKTAESRYDVFYDGILTLTGSVFADTNLWGTATEIWWGDITYSANSVCDWQSIRHNAAPGFNVSVYCAAEICWPSESNKTYQVQWVPSLSATNWTNLGSPVPGTGTNACIFDSTRGQIQRYYRVEVVQ